MVAFKRYIDRSQKEFMNRSLLIIEDDPDELIFLTHRFIRAGYHVISADHPRQALEVAKSQSFQVAIVDLSLRDIDRVDFLRRLVRCQEFLQPIVLSSYLSNREPQTQTGNNFVFLPKPCRWSTLELTVEDAWERACSEQRRSERPTKAKRMTVRP